ncbi:MAG: OmpH family outer membrane protein [Desulfobacterales bacterium]|nr:OmpH family outer membrane protein [Desulfobacterales bacterium]
MRKRMMIGMLASAILALFTMDAVAADLKIGVVDFQKVVNDSEPGKKFEANLKAEGQQMEAEIDQGKAELKELKEKLERESMVMSEKAKEEKQIEFNVKLSGLQKKQAQFRKDFVGKQRKGLAQFEREVLEIAHEIGKKEKYTLIVSKSALLYMDGAVDITPKVVKALNQRHKAQGNQ